MTAGRSRRGDEALFTLFALFVFSSAFSIAISQIFLGLTLAWFIVLLVKRRENPFGGRLKTLYFAIGLYVLWMLISPLAGSTPLKSFLMEREDWLFAVLPIGIYLMAQERYRGRLVTVLAAAVVLMSVYGIVQYYTGLHWPRPKPPTPTADGRYFIEGTFANHLTYGNYFATAAGFLLGWLALDRQKYWDARRGWHWLALLLGLAATVMSYARTAAAAVVAAALLAAGLRSRRRLAATAALAVVAAALTLWLAPGVAQRFELALKRDFAGNSEAARVNVWQKSLAIACEHPVFGVGHGHFPEFYALQNDTAEGESRVFPHAHNDLLTVAAVTGWPGAALFVVMWGAVVGLLVRVFRTHGARTIERRLAGASLAGAAAFLVCSITEATFFDEEVRQLLMFVWAAGLWPLAGQRGADGGGATERAGTARAAKQLDTL